MDLLPAQLKSRLPALTSQDRDDNPMVYARYFVPGTIWSWYVLEGEAEGGDFLFFGFVAGMTNEFRLFRLSELQALRGQAGQTVELDLTFPEGRLTEVVPAPDL